MAAVAIQHQYKAAMADSIRAFTVDPKESNEIAGGVIALMLREMYKTQGVEWLEAVLKQVLE